MIKLSLASFTLQFNKSIIKYTLYEEGVFQIRVYSSRVSYNKPYYRLRLLYSFARET